MTSSPAHSELPTEDDEPALLDASEAAEEIVEDDDDEQDHPMDSDPEEETEEVMQLQNDSVAHFDRHKDSIYSIAQHPTNVSMIATGGGDDTTFVWSSDLPSRPLPASYETSPSAERESLQPMAKLSGHTDSINAITFTLPNGDYLLTGGLDGQLRAHVTQSDFKLLASSQEVPEINFIRPCPNPQHPNTIALGASDGSVWVYTIDASDHSTPLQVRQAYYLHTQTCTAGAWTPDGQMLATVSGCGDEDGQEDGSFYLWDPFGAAAAAGITGRAGSSSQAVVGLTMDDQRFAVEGGLYSVAIAPSGAFAVVGGAGGMIRVVGLPRLGAGSTTGAPESVSGGAKNQSGGGGKKKKSSGVVVPDTASSGQAGQILASLQTQSDSIETLSFSSPPLTLLAAGSVDGSIALFDHGHRFAVRRHIKDAHEGYAVIQVEFLSAESGKLHHVLTSCGNDGVVRRWDTRGGGTTVAAAAAGAGGGGQPGLLGEWRGHRGQGEKGGVLGFVQAGMAGRRIVTAGDDGVSLVFDAG
ncbi:MAG: hypothetical protein Q9163_001740 [Psora crenata]